MKNVMLLVAMMLFSCGGSDEINVVHQQFVDDFGSNGIRLTDCKDDNGDPTGVTVRVVYDTSDEQIVLFENSLKTVLSLTRTEYPQGTFTYEDNNLDDFSLVKTGTGAIVYQYNGNECHQGF